MRVEIDRDDLAAALVRLKPVIGRVKHGCALVVAAGDLIQLYVQDDVLLTVRVPGRVSEEGQGWLFYRAAAALVRQLPRLPVQLGTGEGDALKLESGGGSFSLTPPVVPSFRDVPDPAFSVRSVLPGSAFAALKTAALFMGDAYRPVLNCVLLQAADAESLVRIAATNGHRLAEYSIALPAAAEGFRTRLPRQAVYAVSAAVGADALELSGSADGWIRLRWARSECIWRDEPDKVYPDYSVVFPPSPAATWEVERASLVDCAKRLAVLCSKDEPFVSVSFNGVGGIISRSRRKDPLISASQVVGGDYTGPEGFAFGVGVFYLHETTKALTAASRLRLSFVTPERAILVEDAEPSPDADVSSRFVLMPMRMRD